jgi:4-amino-4-deoxy-L-arabinose transferase-like glycosyltransferase
VIRSHISRRELVGLAAIIALAAATRFVGLTSRGTWDADQGHAMLVLLHLVRDGTIPLIGPATSIGDFYHGALYYYLLAPAAFLSGADPTVVVGEVALAGVAAVIVTWWLARSIAGPIAGLVTGLVMAISSSAIDESTFIWNPNLVALSGAVALAAAWRARTTGRARWWLMAAVGLLVTMQCHVLGIALLPPVAGLWVSAWRAAPHGLERRRLGLAALGAVAIILLGHAPLAIYEVGHGFAGIRSALSFAAAGGAGVSLSLPARFLFVGLRIVAWPLTGLLTDGLAIGVVAGVTVATGLAWRIGQGPGRERTAGLWLAGTLVFGWLVLVFAAPALSSVTPLPVDHYHAFLDPVVFIALGLVAAAVWTDTGAVVNGAIPPVAGAGAEARAGVAPDQVAATGPSLRVGRGGITAALIVLVAWNVWIWPPGVAADGGWPGAAVAADRIATVAGDRTIQMIGLPAFKSTEAYGFPLAWKGRSVVERLPADAGGLGVDPSPRPEAALVIVCDGLFVTDCGGPAEDGSLRRSWPVPVQLVDRWQAAPGRTISVYLPGP